MCHLMQSSKTDNLLVWEIAFVVNLIQNLYCWTVLSVFLTFVYRYSLHNFYPFIYPYALYNLISTSHSYLNIYSFFSPILHIYVENTFKYLSSK